MAEQGKLPDSSQPVPLAPEGSVPPAPATTPPVEVPKAKKKRIKKDELPPAEGVAHRVPPPPPHNPPPPQAGNQTSDVDAILADADEKDKKIIEDLFKGAFKRWTKKQDQDRGMATVATVVESIHKGSPLNKLDSELIPLLGEQMSKASIVQAAMFNHQLERLVLYWDMRWHLERDLWEDLRSQRLRPIEKLALLKLAAHESKSISDYINGYNPPQPLQEVAPQLERASKPVVEKARSQHRKEFAGTTAAGRESVRRLTYKASAKAKQIVQQAQAEKKEAKAEKKEVKDGAGSNNK